MRRSGGNAEERGQCGGLLRRKAHSAGTGLLLATAAPKSAALRRHGREYALRRFFLGDSRRAAGHAASHILARVDDCRR